MAMPAFTNNQQTKLSTSDSSSKDAIRNLPFTWFYFHLMIVFIL
uniref:Uncharacterized protein n=1 Tax=Anguilla anguilla TaxID=7936 RepID=A0A0E9RBN1_ANGAN